MPTTLLEQLAAELGCSTDEAERVLHDFLAEVETRAAEGETVSLPGLGTFSMDEGTLQFTPAPALQQAVNYRNAHLEPLSVSAPRDRDEPEDAPEAPPADVPDTETTPSDEAEAPDEAPAAGEAESPPPAEPDDVPDLSEDWTESLDEDVDAPEQELSDEPTTGQIAGLVASVVLLLGLIWFVLGTQGIIPGPTVLFQRTPAPTPPGADTMATASPSDTAATEREAAADTTASDPAASPPTLPTIDRATGGWTIVVASRTRPGQAEAVLSTYRQRFQGEGLPVDILTGQASGQLRYRVAVGQYPTREAAQSALQQLQGRVSGDAWPLEIQPGS